MQKMLSQLREENAFVGNTEILRVVGARPAARSEMVRENELLALCF